MSCRTVISYLNAYADGELPEKQRLSVKDHLTTCEACQERLEEIHSLEALFQSSLPVPPVPDGLAAQVMDAARGRHSARALKRRFPYPAWNLLQRVAGLSASMRIAACAAMLLALITGLSLDGGWMTGRGMNSEPGKNISGLEWFDPAPPGSISSIYIAMTTQTYQEGNRP